MRHEMRSTRFAGLAFLGLVLTVVVWTTACDEAMALDGVDAHTADALLLQDVGTPGGFTVEPLARGTFKDAIDVMLRMKMNPARDPSTKVIHVDDPSDLVVVKLTIEEGGSVGWHTHPGPAIVAVQSGTLGIIMANDCIVRPYPAGSALIDPGQGNVHVGYNAGESAVIAYVTFLDVPAGQPATIPADDPGC